MAIMCSRRVQQVVQVQVVFVFLVGGDGVAGLLGFAGGLRVFGGEYVAGAAAADVGGAEGVAADDTVVRELVLVVVGGSGGKGWEEKEEKVYVRLNILPLPRLDGIQVLCHVTVATAAGRHHGRLEGGCLQVFGLETGGLGAVDDVAGAAAA